MALTTREANDLIREKMQELMRLSNRIGQGSPRAYNAVIEASVALQDYLEKNE